MEKEGIIRLILFVLTATSLVLWEILAPRRTPEADRKQRWIGNLGVVVLSTLLVRLFIPIAPTVLAATLHAKGWGILPHLGLPGVMEIVAGALLLDLAIYAQHRAFHRWHLLWRLHRMHHADTFYDFSTGIRFHPLEIMLSMAFKLTVISVLGPPAIAVLLFEIGLNCIAMFNHANIRLSEPLDKILRLFVVTPDMHRVHHSTDRVEMNCNFGFNAPWWDRIFGTYQPQPALGHEAMTIGLTQYREKKYRSFFRMLAIPFQK